MKKLIKEDCGALAVEATIVFPVCLLIIILLLYLGNVYYQKARVEACVTEAVLDGAAYSVDPLLEFIEAGKIEQTALGAVDYKPYRYIGGMFGGMKDIEERVRSVILGRVGNLDTGLFSNMKPGRFKLTVSYNGGFLASSVSADLEYRIELPIRLLGEKERVSMKFQTHTEVPVSDSPEFVRNVNLVEDLLEVTGVKAKITEKVKELKGFFDKLFHK